MKIKLKRLKDLKHCTICFLEHWTAGREGSLAQFYSEDNNETLSATVLSPFTNTFSVNCITFHPDNESFVN